MRLWELTDFDAVLYVDSDVEVLGNVAPAFDLPTDFAVAMDPNKEGYSCAPSHAHPINAPLPDGLVSSPQTRPLTSC